MPEPQRPQRAIHENSAPGDEQSVKCHFRIRRAVDDQITAEHDCWPVFICRSQLHALTGIHVDRRCFRVATAVRNLHDAARSHRVKCILNRRVRHRNLFYGT